MRKFWIRIAPATLIGAAVLAAVLLSGCQLLKPAPTPTPAPTPEITAEPTPTPTPEPTPTPTPEPTPEPTPSVITVAGTGDLMCHESNYVAAYDKSSGTYDFTRYFQYIAPFIQKADIAIGNFEVTLAGKDDGGYSGYPRFNAPDEYLGAVTNMGFDVLTTANNHSYDKQYKGAMATLDKLDANGVAHTGTFRNQKENETPTIVEANGVKVGVIAYTYGSNIKPSSAPDEDEPYVLNQLWDSNGKLRIEAIRADIQRCRDAGADVVLFCAHWGAEYTSGPNGKTVDAAEKILAAGADAILGHHPHALHPIKMVTVEREDGSTYTGPVIYSMGNFFCNPSKEECTKSGMITYLRFEKDNVTGKTKFLDLNYLPTYIYRQSSPRDYRLLPVGYALDNTGECEGLGSKIKNTLTKIWESTLKTVGTENGAQPIRE
ncbi:MAG: CapA family protein [Eubacteriales bacterium]|nr:CapA family protein [Eubacteriales bacterium]